MDNPTSEIEGAAHLTVHGQFMPLERYASAGLHVWQGSQILHLQALLVYQGFLIFSLMLATGSRVPKSARLGHCWETRSFGL